MEFLRLIILLLLGAAGFVAWCFFQETTLYLEWKMKKLKHEIFDLTEELELATTPTRQMGIRMGIRHRQEELDVVINKLWRKSANQ